MADPALIELTANEWKKVATAVQSGVVAPMISTPNKYLHDYRATGGAAPLNSEIAKKLAFNGTAPKEIKSYFPIDVYVMAIGHNGQVQVFL